MGDPRKSKNEQGVGTGDDGRRFENRTSIGARSDVGSGVGPGMGSSIGPSVGAGIGPSMGETKGSFGAAGGGRGVDIGPGAGSHVQPSSGAPSVGQGGKPSGERMGSSGQLPPEETARDRSQDAEQNTPGAGAAGGPEGSGAEEDESLGEKVKGKVSKLADKVKKAV